MAFWGVKVKPGKPYTHLHHESTASGDGGGKAPRLRITQATLGRKNYSETGRRSILQCHVGSRRPVIICSLLPNRLESISLDLEFHENEPVVFSVIGPTTIHLAGYIPYNKYPEEEEIGEDIAETESDRSKQSDDNEDDDLSDFVVGNGVVEYDTTSSSDEETSKLSSRRLSKKRKAPSNANLETNPKCSKKKRKKKKIANESENSDDDDIVKSFFFEK